MNLLPKSVNRRRHWFNEQNFLSKLARNALRLGKPVAVQLYTLYLLFKSPETPLRSKMLILGALVYFISPIDLIPDFLGPFGFTDDIAVITMVCRQLQATITPSLKAQAQAAIARFFSQ
ncbi:YkvA family protein [Snodgrassella communis]|uniref:YkvA family protein n=1 Tax=Snodgrassella communis TaxID=2946699 RepID=UPI001EF6B028|nr:YkvA family protein [Snodgrassella communis]WMY91165.1 YkvA family protein [Snodgrassella communis]